MVNGITERVGSGDEQGDRDDDAVDNNDARPEHGVMLRAGIRW